MGRAELKDPAQFGLRWIRDDDALMFAAWESVERPYPWTPTQFRETSASTNGVRILVSEDAGGVTGYAAVQIMDGEAYLSNIMVEPVRRRRGIGAALLQKVIMWAASNGV